MTHARAFRALALAALVPLAACAESTAPPRAEDGAPVSDHVAFFNGVDNPADDPGSDRERRAMDYAAGHFRSLGLKTTVQQVPLVRMIPESAALQVTGPGGTALAADLASGGVIMWSGRQEPQVALDAEVVFAGYGIVSPEYHRDDFKDVDVTGKLVIVLEGAPHTGTRNDLGLLGETYYGTRLYKFDEAARQGAAGVLIIHSLMEEPWIDLQRQAARSILDLDRRTDDDPGPKAAVEGWLSREAVEPLLRASGQPIDQLILQARELAFRPIVLTGLRATATLNSRIERVTSANVIAVLPGRHPEHVLLAGRWNRIDPEVWAGRSFAAAEGGAVPDGEAPLTSHLNDDGSGAAAVMETARRLAADRKPPLRSIVFLVATALKPGLIGLEYYREHPVLPEHKLDALILFDRADLSGTSQRIGKIGTGSDIALSQITRQSAIEQGRLVELDENPHRRFYYKTGHTKLARDGVRMIVLTATPEEDGSSRRLRHVAHRDHVVGLGAQPLVKAGANPGQDAALLAHITRRVANATNWPPRHEPAGTAR